jgi:hypothetical protein
MSEWAENMCIVLQDLVDGEGNSVFTDQEFVMAVESGFQDLALRFKDNAVSVPTRIAKVSTHHTLSTLRASTGKLQESN